MKDAILENLNLFIWAKDKNYKYIYCNENYARAAGIDSPEQIVGRSDDQMPWREQADFFRQGDFDVFEGKSRINVPEVEIMTDKVADILVTENQLLDKSGKCVGLVGSYIDITGQRLIKKTGFYDQNKQRYFLGPDLDDEYLTVREVEVFKRILLGYSARQIGEVLKISPKTVEGYIENLRRKLQASSKGEIIATAIQYGLTQILYLQTHSVET